MRSFTLSLVALAFAGFLIAAPETEKKSPPSDKKTRSADKAKDPVCGMMVDPKTADKATYQGKTYYFCSRDEKLEFEKNPSKYAKK
jgi:YHS domain-containing protein